MISRSFHWFRDFSLILGAFSDSGALFPIPRHVTPIYDAIVSIFGQELTRNSTDHVRNCWLTSE
jgi:hypothetical protein